MRTTSLQTYVFYVYIEQYSKLDLLKPSWTINRYFEHPFNAMIETVCGKSCFLGRSILLFLLSFFLLLSQNDYFNLKLH